MERCKKVLAWYFVDDVTDSLKTLVRACLVCDEPDIEAMARQLIDALNKYKEENDSTRKEIENYKK